MKRDHKSFIDHIIDLLAVLAACMTIFVMLAVGVDVVLRYLFNSPMAWVMEVTEYSLVFIAFAVAARVLREERHVVMDILVVRLKPKSRSFLDSITSIVGSLVCLIIAVFSAKVTWDFLCSGAYANSVLEPPKYILYMIMPVGSFLLFIQFVRRVSKYVSIWKETRQREQINPSDEVSN